MLLRGFLAPIRDFTELNLLCYMLRLQDAKRSEMEVGSGKSGKSKPFYKQVGLMSSEVPIGMADIMNRDASGDYGTTGVYQTT
jgi:hypothetical protein